MKRFLEDDHCMQLRLITAGLMCRTLKMPQMVEVMPGSVFFVGIEQSKN